MKTDWIRPEEAATESWQVNLGDDTYELTVDPETERVTDCDDDRVLTGLDLPSLETAVYKLGGTMVKVMKA